MKKIIIIISFIIGLVIGFCISKFAINTTNNEQNTATYSLDYANKIKSSFSSNENVNTEIDELEKLYTELEKVENNATEIRSRIGILENQLNNDTDLQFENEIYSNND